MNARTAWNDPCADFEILAIPTQAGRQAGRHESTFRNPATEMAVLDWYLFFNE